MKLVLAEKPSVAQSIAKVLGAAKREDGYLEGNGYVVSWCVSFHYVDSVGFQKLENFMKSENYLKNAEMAMEDDYGMIDGNAAFVKTVRMSGGWNESRWLLLPAYASRYQEQALEAMELPEDPYLIVSVHAYIPYSFVTGETNWTSYDSSDTQRIDQMMASLYRVFLRKKIPVIITEFGCQVSVDFDQQLDWTQYYVSAAQKRGVPCLWWDDGKKYKLINRETLEWEYPEIANILLNQCVTE